MANNLPSTRDTQPSATPPSVNSPSLNSPSLKSPSDARPPAPKGLLLPGVAGIAMFLLVLALLNTFAALRGIYGAGGGRYGVLAVCTLLVVGIFGLLRMRRWGWSVVTAGTLLLAVGYMVLFTRTHTGPFAVQSLFGMVFFLYLVRPEVRDRLR